jgi:hypothetical protein
MIENTEEAIDNVVEGLCYLILNHAKCCAAEQYYPTRTADDSDDYIRDHSEWINKLRVIREQFEDLATGFIPRHEPSTYQIVKEQIAGAAKEVFEGYISKTPSIRRATWPSGDYIAQDTNENTGPIPNTYLLAINKCNEKKRIRRATWPSGDYIAQDTEGVFAKGRIVYWQRKGCIVKQYDPSPEDKNATDWAIAQEERFDIPLPFAPLVDPDPSLDNPKI